ncbi:MAG: IS1595 family transposase [Rhodospirillales bacterium]|nr:IS1595 family transposase [Rhodospirillales bacterium]
MPERRNGRRGGQASKRGLSEEQVPVLVAADRTGATVSAILPAVADAIGTVLAPVLNKDALLVTDGARVYPPCAAKLGGTHEALNQPAGERGRGELHIQTVNSRHERLKAFLRRYRGIATKYLDSDLKWFHLAGIRLDPSPRTGLNAAMGRA